MNKSWTALLFSTMTEQDKLKIYHYNDSSENIFAKGLNNDEGQKRQKCIAKIPISIKK